MLTTRIALVVGSAALCSTAPARADTNASSGSQSAAPTSANSGDSRGVQRMAEPTGAEEQPAAGSAKLETSARRWAISAKTGLMRPGTVTVGPNDSSGGEVDLDTESGLVALGKVDVWVTPWLSTGLQGLLSYTTIDIPIDDNEANVVNVGATLKAHIDAAPLSIAPGLALSYQVTFAETYDETVKGFSPGAFVECLIPIVPDLRGVAEVGFISQPYGGNADFDVTFGPIFYVVVGAEYSD